MKLAIVGHSDSGKTSIITTIIKELKESGISVATVKHAHGAHSLFPEEKDTTLHLQAGATPVVGISPNETAIYLAGSTPPEEVLGLLEKMADPDVILIEGFKESSFPKVALGNVDSADPVLLRGEKSEDIVTDVLELINREVETERVLEQLPQLACGKCGYPTCRELAEAIVEGDKTVDDCKNRPREDIRIKVNGEEVSVGGFVSEFVSNTVSGMISSLKGVENIRTIEIIIEKQ